VQPKIRDSQAILNYELSDGCDMDHENMEMKYI
jgi:hypothetical protein